MNDHWSIPVPLLLLWALLLFYLLCMVGLDLALTFALGLLLLTLLVLLPLPQGRNLLILDCIHLILHNHAFLTTFRATIGASEDEE